MDLLQVKSVGKKDEKGFHLSDINFNQKSQQKIAIAGETGSGKTTLLKIIAGLAQPDNGEVFFKNEKVIGPADKLIPGHKGIVYLSQDFRLPHFLRVEQILEYANEWPIEKAEKLFSLCHIKHLFKRRTDELSGGEQQRIAIARLLIMDPQLFLLDEPFSNMDPDNKDLLKNIIEDIGHEFNMSFIMISHDPVDTLPWADEIIVMKDGRLIEKDTSTRIYSKPAFAYTASLFGKFNLLPVELFQAMDKVFEVPSGFQAVVRPEKCMIVDNFEMVDQTVPERDKIEAEGDTTEVRNQSILILKGNKTGDRYFGHYFETDLLIAGHKITCRSQFPDTNSSTEKTVAIAERDIILVQI